MKKTSGRFMVCEPLGPPKIEGVSMPHGSRDSACPYKFFRGSFCTNFPSYRNLIVQTNDL